MITTYDLETGALQELTNGFDPAISPDGTTVAFVRDGGAAGLYLIGSDGGDERLISASAVSSARPSRARTASRLVFGRSDEYVECYDMGYNRCVTQDELDDMLEADARGRAGGRHGGFSPGEAVSAPTFGRGSKR